MSSERQSACMLRKRTSSSAGASIYLIVSTRSCEALPQDDLSEDTASGKVAVGRCHQAKPQQASRDDGSPLAQQLLDFCDTDMKQGCQHGPLNRLR